MQAIGVSIGRRKWPWDKYTWIYKCTAQPYVNKLFGVSLWLGGVRWDGGWVYA